MAPTRPKAPISAIGSNVLLGRATARRDTVPYVDVNGPCLAIQHPFAELGHPLTVLL